VPFDYQNVNKPDLILDYGLRYRQASQYDRWQGSLEAMSLRNLDTALQVMNVLVDRFGDGYRFYKAEVLYNYARYYFRNGAFEEAIAAYERVIALDPASEWIRLEWATTLLFAGRWEETKTIYDEWLGKKWDPAVSAYARTWDEAFYKYLRDAAKIVSPKDAELLKKAEQYLLEVMSQ
jgi:tetratricopeptide (TPR) repeat protein